MAPLCFPSGNITIFLICKQKTLHYCLFLHYMTLMQFIKYLFARVCPVFLSNIFNRSMHTCHFFNCFWLCICRIEECERQHRRVPEADFSALGTDSSPKATRRASLIEFEEQISSSPPVPAVVRTPTPKKMRSAEKVTAAPAASPGMLSHTCNLLLQGYILYMHYSIYTNTRARFLHRRPLMIQPCVRTPTPKEDEERRQSSCGCARD